MPNEVLKDGDPCAQHSPDQERPLRSYASLIATFFAAAGAFASWLRFSDTELPERIDAKDLALVSVGTYKLSRLIARDRITSVIRAPFTRFQNDAGPGEVDEAARGHGLQRAIGELIICPYCLDLWVSAGFIGGLIVLPRSTRWMASVFTVMTAADVMQLAHHNAQEGVEA